MEDLFKSDGNEVINEEKQQDPVEKKPIRLTTGFDFKRNNPYCDDEH